MERLLACCLLGSVLACSGYTCGTGVPEGQCAVLTDNTYNLTACASGYECNLSSGACEAKNDGIAAPGEQCKSSLTCMTGDCKSGICVGAILGESCASDLECNPGLFCSSLSVCSTQLAIGKSGCQNDYQCVNNAFCNETGVCTSYFSIASYSSIGSCGISYVSWQCDSGACYNTASGPMCTPALESFAPAPIKCMSDSDCISKVDPSLGFRYTTACTCSYTVMPTSYCNAMPGDPVYTGLVASLKAWLSSKYVDKCNTARRFSLNCVGDVWNEASALELEYYWNWFYLFPYVQNSQSCVRNILATDYWTAAQAYNDYELLSDDYDDYNAATLLGLTCLGGALM